MPQLLRTMEAAKVLNITRSTLWRMTLEGRIRAIRFRKHGSPRYDLAGIQSLIGERKQGADGC